MRCDRAWPTVSRTWQGFGLIIRCQAPGRGFAGAAVGSNGGGHPNNRYLTIRARDRRLAEVPRRASAGPPGQPAPTFWIPAGAGRTAGTRPAASAHFPDPAYFAG